VHVFKYPEQVASTMKLLGAFTHVLSLKQIFHLHLQDRRVIAAQVVLVIHPPPILQIIQTIP
jgi:hypothetical protein